MRSTRRHRCSSCGGGAACTGCEHSTAALLTCSGPTQPAQQAPEPPCLPGLQLCPEARATPRKAPPGAQGPSPQENPSWSPPRTPPYPLPPRSPLHQSPPSHKTVGFPRLWTSRRDQDSPPEQSSPETKGDGDPGAQLTCFTTGFSGGVSELLSVGGPELSIVLTHTSTWACKKLLNT